MSLHWEAPNKMPEPKVSILMPVYNGEKYLREAIESILSQTFKDFEFLIINDGSTDRSVEIVQSYKDPRIRLIHNGANIGLIKSLNRGLELARGEYIARMDSDDISLPKRLDTQVAFMNSHPEVGVCGTWVKTIGEPAGHVWDYPADDARIRCRFIFESVIAHPTAMLRKAAFAKAGLCYDISYGRAEDYELWVRASRHMSFANIAEVLVLYRLHPAQVGKCHNEEQQRAARAIRLEQLSNLGVHPATEEFEIHQSISIWRFRPTGDFLKQVDAWLRKLKAANKRTSTYPEPAFSKVLGERWFAACNAATGLGLWTWRAFRQSPLSEGVGLNCLQKMKFMAKCGLRYGTV